MARLMFLTYYYPPELGAAAQLNYLLTTELAKRGHEVVVVTGYPRYNARYAGEKYESGKFMREWIDGVEVVRVFLPQLPRTKPILRGGEEFINAALLFGVAALQKPADASFAFSPPLPVALADYFLKKLHGTPAIVNIQDLFPKEAIDIGVLKNPKLIRILEALETFIYKKVDHVVAHSEGNRAYIVSRGGDVSQVHTVHNWIDLEDIHPGPRDNEFRKANVPEGKFCVSYAGTMGWNQDMATLLRTAAELKDYEDIYFLLVGDGNNKADGERMAEEMGLENVCFKPSVPYDEYKELIRASDVGLVNLNPLLLSPVVPSKMVNLMGSAIPVAASLPLGGDAPKIIQDADCGFVVDAGDHVGLAKSILTLYQDQDAAKQMGRNGRKYAEEHFSLEVCTSQIEELLVQYTAH